MLSYDVLVIGFGKAGKTLAAKMAQEGKKVALIEQSQAMYGGTCINIACIPTKTLIAAAEKNLSFDEAMTEKTAVVERLNHKNYKGLSQAVDVINAKARFLSDKVIEISQGDDKKELTAETIVINTGAVSNRLPIPGLETTQSVYDSTGIQALQEQPKHLGILGGGNIGLEFAHLYNSLGSQVTVLDAAESFLPRVEPSIADLAKGYLEEDGIAIHLGLETTEIKNTDQGQVEVVTKTGSYVFDALLYATGRKPNTAELNLEATGISLTEKGAIAVDKNCQTTVPGVFAVGDVRGGLQFTYISLDDFRVVFDYLTGDGSYTLDDRGAVPTAIFIKPALAQVGLTEKKAKEQGLPYATKELPVSSMPRGHVNADLRGAFKVVVNTESKAILGATLFAEGAEEIINIITLAINHQIPYTALAKQIMTHPTMSENLNDLFAID